MISRKKKEDLQEIDSADDCTVDMRVLIIVVELGDVGEKRVESEEEMDLPSFGMEEEKEIIDDPYQKWFNKRSFTDQDKAYADTILLELFVMMTRRSSYSMEPVSIADQLQCKISTNGIENIGSTLSSASFTPVKVC